MDLLQSTSQIIKFRAFLASDGKTPATGKTIAITISKNGAAFGNPSAGATNATELSSGWYYFTASTTDTNTLGAFAFRGAQADIDDVGRDYRVKLVPTIPDNTTIALIYALLQLTDSDVASIESRIPAALTSNGNMKSSLLEIISTTLTEGAAGRIAAAWQGFWNLATPTGNVNSLPAAAPGALNGLIIGSVNANIGQADIERLKGGNIDYVVGAGADPNALRVALLENAVNTTSLADSAVTEIQDGLATQTSVDNFHDSIIIGTGTILTVVSPTEFYVDGLESAGIITGGYVGCLIRFNVSIGTKNSTRPITEYTYTVGNDNRLVIDEAFVSTPLVGDTFEVIIHYTHSIASLQAGLATQTSVDAIQVDVDANTGYLTSLVSSMTTLLGRVTANVYTMWTDLIAMITGSGVDPKYTTAALSNAPSGGGGGGDATAANQTIIITHLTDIKGVGWSSTTDSLVKIAEAIAAAGSSLLGPGDDDVTITIEDDGNPVENVNVWISVDADGSDVIAGSLPTDGAGQITFLLTDGATYYLWAHKAGKIDIRGQVFVAEADA